MSLKLMLAGLVLFAGLMALRAAMRARRRRLLEQRLLRRTQA